jgi:L-ascorbate metabolism protein UlaG (beta-lactamase superfamily)
MLKKIKWLGHASIRIESDMVIYIDPWKIKSGPKADLILISHSHHDHLSPADIKKIQKEDTVIVAAADVVARFSGDVRALKPGETATVRGVTVEAVPAYNIGKPYHPRAKEWIGFVVTLEDKNIYFAGDTDLIPEMKNIKADIAILPVGGIYTMTAQEAAEAVKVIKPEAAIPIHYGEVAGTEEDARTFKALCAVHVDMKTPTS